MLASRGLGVRPDYSYSRVLNGFSAALDSRAVAMLSATPRSRASTRCAPPSRRRSPPCPASRRASRARRRSCRGDAARLRRPRADDRAARHRRRPQAAVPRRPGRAGARPRRRQPPTAQAQPNPRSRRRSSGTGRRWPGCSSASGGPDGLHGVAPGATVFPIRVAGWQPDAEGRSVVYGRSDQLIAGLERAVDPNGDGDAHDAARIALIGLAEPFAVVRRQSRGACGRRRARARHPRRRARRERRRGRSALRLARRARRLSPTRSPSARPTSAPRRRPPTSSCARVSTSCSTRSCRCSDSVPLERRR